MKKALMLAFLGAVFIGGCAPKPKVEPAPAPKPAESTAGNKDYMGASGSTPSGGSGMSSPAMGQIPESTPTDTPPHNPSGSGRSGTGATHVSSSGSGSTTAKPASSGKTTASAHGVKYVVKKGDTLGAIAKKHYGKSGSATIKKIVAANPGMNPDKIRVGQTIVLP